MPHRAVNCCSRCPVWRCWMRLSASVVTEAASQDAAFVGRVREDISHPHGLNLWVMADARAQGRGAEWCAK